MSGHYRFYQILSGDRPPCHKRWLSLRIAVVTTQKHHGDRDGL